MFLPHFHVFSDLLLYRPVATWNLFVLWDKKRKCVCRPIDHRLEPIKKRVYFLLSYKFR